MSCYHPNGFIFANGQPSRFIGKLSQARIDAFTSEGYEVVPVPCQRCIGCRLDTAKNWSDRMLAEYATDRSDTHGYPSRTALFATITYDDDHVPYVPCTDGVQRRSLDKRDVQLFHHSLRKDVFKLNNRRIRFYLAGEYGERTFRPHYHAIYYGLSVEDIPFLRFYKSTDYGDLFISTFLDDIWGRGNIIFADASFQTFAYVSRYVVKKQYTGDLSMSYRGRLPPFNLMSNRPGIGADFFDDVLDPAVYLSDGVDNHKIKVPRIVSNKLALTDPDLYDIIKNHKRTLAKGHSDLLKAQLGKDYFDYLQTLEDLHKQRTDMIHRDLGGN